MTEPHYWLVVPAAGIGQRMQADCPKQYLRIRNRYIADITLSRLMATGVFKGCMVALNGQDRLWQETASARDPGIGTCIGGDERSDSVLAALDALAAEVTEDDWVLVHDVARPCIRLEDLSRLLAAGSEHAVGGLLATPVSDTLKRADGNRQIAGTVDRHNLWRALTPQMFRYGSLRQALICARDHGVAITDEASAMEYKGLSPLLVEGRPDNIKITLPEDLPLADFILSQIADHDGPVRRE